MSKTDEEEEVETEEVEDEEEEVETEEVEEVEEVGGVEDKEEVEEEEVEDKEEDEEEKPTSQACTYTFLAVNVGVLSVMAGLLFGYVMQRMEEMSELGVCEAEDLMV